MTFFNSSFFETSADARFVLLVIAVETLLEPTTRSGDARDHIDRLIEQTQKTALPDDEKRSMLGQLRYLYTRSIRQLAKALITFRLPRARYRDREAWAFFDECYELRSRLVHGAAPAPSFEEISRAAATLELLVSDLLTAPVLGERPGPRSAQS